MTPPCPPRLATLHPRKTSSWSITPSRLEPSPWLSRQGQLAGAEMGGFRAGDPFVRLWEQSGNSRISQRRSFPVPRTCATQTGPGPFSHCPDGASM